MHHPLEIQLALVIALKIKDYETKQEQVTIKDYIQILKNKLLNQDKTDTKTLSEKSTEKNTSTLFGKQSIYNAALSLGLSQFLVFDTSTVDAGTNNDSFVNTQELIDNQTIVQQEDLPILKQKTKPKSDAKQLEFLPIYNVIEVDYDSNTQSNQASIFSSLNDFKTDYYEIRKAILRLTKQNALIFLPVRKKLLSLFNVLYLHSKKGSTFLEANMLSSAFLKFMTRIYDIPLITNIHIHELFKITINCYLINFNYFINGIRGQYNILFQFMFDVLAINSKYVEDYGQSFLRRITKHKIKTQLTKITNEHHLQILIYYLIQLMFLLLDSTKFTVNDIQFAEEKLRKLLAFLIKNNNSELLQKFQKNRLKFKRKHNLK